MSRRLRARSTRALALLTLAVSALPALAASKDIRLLPADDPALAITVLIGEGRDRPVLLFDPSDQSALEIFADEEARGIRCIDRNRESGLMQRMLEEAAGEPCEKVDDWLPLVRRLWPKATRVVAAPSTDYDWMLEAGAFAAATGTALLPVDPGRGVEPAALEEWNLETIYLTPGSLTIDAAQKLAPHVVSFQAPEDLTAALLDLRGAEPPTAVVVTNPRDREGLFSPSSLSLLAPLVSGIHRAPLVLARNSAPTEIEKQVLDVIQNAALPTTHIVLVGDELALKSHRVPDPVLAAGGPEAIGGGTEVRAEIFSEIQQGRPQDFAVGRIVAEDVAEASAALARQLHSRPKKPTPVVVLSNADEVFALGETISRATVNELRNRGVTVHAYFRNQITPKRIRSALGGTDFLVWEGHARDLTLEERGGVNVRSTPRLVFLQGCYTLDRSDPFILMERGTQAIVATSAAIYSASGSAFAKAFFDSLLYEDADLGTAVRNARNYLLALTRLKQLRGHADWPKTLRAALAFALWGDPTLSADLHPRKPGVPPATWSAEEESLTLKIPGGRLPEARVAHYRSAPVPRAMLGGLLVYRAGEEERRPKQTFFAVRQVPTERVACAPNAAWDVVSEYAPRTHTLSVLARPEWSRMPPGRARGTFSFPLAPDPEACAALETVGPPSR